MMDKATSCKSAVERIPDGASLMIGGFMGVGSPHRIIDELVRQGRKDLTVIANDSGRVNFGIGRLIADKLIKKLITSHIGVNPETQRQMIDGEIEV
jgi:acetate CoA/acetoacetate CoA-transferase alpha subunit